jgi:hypothetical protein
MSLLTTAYLLEKYGPLLTEDQVGETLHLSGKTVCNQRVLGLFPIPSSKQGNRVLYHAADVAEYIDSMRHAVRAAA